MTNYKGYTLSVSDNESDFFAAALGEIMPGAKPLSGMNLLLTQLSRRSPEATLATIGAFFRSGGAVAMATSDSNLVGIACLVPSIKINGTAGRIEEVVVAEGHRNKGLARRLLQELIALGQTRGYSCLDLTTNPGRVEAKALYASLGFLRQETNSYRLALSRA